MEIKIYKDMLQGYEEVVIGSKHCIFYKKAIGHYKDDLPTGLIMHYNNMGIAKYKSHVLCNEKIGCEYHISQYQDGDRIVVLGKYQRYYNKPNFLFGEEIVFR